MICPCCNGVGKIEKKSIIDRKLRRHKARQLRKLGFTYVEIMKAVGYKSPRSVALAIKRND